MTQEALKLALEALKSYGNRHRATYLLDGAWDAEITLGDKAFAAIKEALAQPEQEPVAWVSEDVCEGQYIDGRPRKIWWECSTGVGTAFYTTPPQRTWVGLTVNEIALINTDYPLPQGFAKAIEAKLKERNT